MNFLKSLKVRVLQQLKQQSYQQKKQAAQKEKLSTLQQSSKQKEKQSYITQKKITSFVTNLYTKYKEQSKNKQINVINQNQNQYDSKRVSKMVDGRFWHTSAKTIINYNNEKQDQSKQKVQVTSQKLNQKQIIQQLQVNQQSALLFFLNMQNHIKEKRKQIQLRIKNNRNQIFRDLSIQPIYMQQSILQNMQIKILKMELETNFNQLVQKTQNLVHQKDIVERAIQNALVSGYLWKAYDQENIDFLSAVFIIVQQKKEKIQVLYQKLKNERQKIRNLLGFINKILDLGRKKKKIAKKLQLLNKIKQHKKDVSIRFQNIDQAFYIQRARQKTYENLLVNQKLVQKVNLLKILKSRVQKQNQRLIKLLEREITKWIDKNETLQKKHIQKLFILLYFTRTQNMYIKDKLRVRLQKLDNKKYLIQKINEVKKWQDYKYVNDKLVKQNVKQFLNEIIKQVGSFKEQIVEIIPNKTQKVQKQEQRKNMTRQKYKTTKNEQNQVKRQQNMMSIIANESIKMKQKLQNGIKF